MRSGWNPTRRNRNTGTEKRGHGQDNRLVVPEGWPHDRLFFEKLNNPVVIPMKVNGTEITFIVEPTLDGFVHACTPEDAVRFLDLVPPSHLCGIEMMIFRQPKRKEIILHPVWGRLVYYSDLGRFSGTAIHLEAQKPGKRTRWPRSQTPPTAAEFKRLQQDGHVLLCGRRFFTMTSSLQAIRNTQLYRTLPHEIGHYRDFSASVLEVDDEFDEDLQDTPSGARYQRKTSDDKEAYAHRYASELTSRLKKSGKVPFDRIVDAKSMRKNGLDMGWFMLDGSDGTSR